jgi:hypothetical protein
MTNKIASDDIFQSEKHWNGLHRRKNVFLRNENSFILSHGCLLQLVTQDLCKLCQQILSFIKFFSLLTVA